MKSDCSTIQMEVLSLMARPKTCLRVPWGDNDRDFRDGRVGYMDVPHRTIRSLRRRKYIRLAGRPSLTHDTYILSAAGWKVLAAGESS